MGADGEAHKQSASTQKALWYRHASRVRKLCFRFGKARSAGVAHHHPSAGAQPREAPHSRDPRAAPHPGEASFPPPQSESKLSHSRSAAAPSRFSSARSCASALAKPALLASLATTPAIKPNHKELPIPRSTPSSPPQEASFPPPQSESKLSHSRSAAVPTRF